MTYLSSDITGFNVKGLGSYNVCDVKLDCVAIRVSGGQGRRTPFVVPFSAEVNSSFPCHTAEINPVTSTSSSPFFGQ